MFYSQVLLRRKGRFGLVWLAATYPHRLTKKDYMSTDVVRACDDILEHILWRINEKDPFSLYLSGQLTYGVVKIHNKLADILYLDIISFHRNMYKIPRKSLGGAIDLPKQPENQKEKLTLQEPDYANFDFEVFDVVPDVPAPDEEDMRARAASITIQEIPLESEPDDEEMLPSFFEEDWAEKPSSPKKQRILDVQTDQETAVVPVEQTSAVSAEAILDVQAKQKVKSSEEQRAEAEGIASILRAAGVAEDDRPMPQTFGELMHTVEDDLRSMLHPERKESSKERESVATEEMEYEDEADTFQLQPTALMQLPSIDESETLQLHPVALPQLPPVDITEILIPDVDIGDVVSSISEEFLREIEEDDFDEIDLILEPLTSPPPPVCKKRGRKRRRLIIDKVKNLKPGVEEYGDEHIDLDALDWKRDVYKKPKIVPADELFSGPGKQIVGKKLQKIWPKPKKVTKPVDYSSLQVEDEQELAREAVSQEESIGTVSGMIPGPEFLDASEKSMPGSGLSSGIPSAVFEAPTLLPIIEETTPMLLPIQPAFGPSDSILSSPLMSAEHTPRSYSPVSTSSAGKAGEVYSIVMRKMAEKGVLCVELKKDLMPSSRMQCASYFASLLKLHKKQVFYVSQTGEEIIVTPGVNFDFP